MRRCAHRRYTDLVLWPSLLLLLIASSCVPQQAIITYKSNEPTVDLSVSHLYPGEQTADTSFTDLQTDSLTGRLSTCTGPTYTFGDSSGYVLIAYPDRQDVHFDTCGFIKSIPLLEFKFDEPISQIEGPVKGVEVSKDRKRVILPYLNNYYKNPTARYKIATGNKPQNYRLRRQLDYLGMSIDIPAAVGPIWYTGDGGFIESGLVSINVISLTFILNNFRVGQRLSFQDFIPDPETVRNTAYDNLSAFGYELVLGYQVLNSDFFTVSPSLILGNKRYEYSGEGELNDPLESGPYLTYGFSLATDFKLQQLLRSREKREEKKYEYFSLKVEAGWYPNLFKAPYDVSGSVVYLNFAIAGNFGMLLQTRRIKRLK